MFEMKSGTDSEMNGWVKRCWIVLAEIKNVYYTASGVSGPGHQRVSSHARTPVRLDKLLQIESEQAGRPTALLQAQSKSWIFAELISHRARVSVWLMSVFPILPLALSLQTRA